MADEYHPLHVGYIEHPPVVHQPAMLDPEWWVSESHRETGEERVIAVCEEEAYAVRVRLACNSHDALLTALQDTQRFLMHKARRDPAERQIIQQISNVIATIASPTVPVPPAQ